VVQYDEEQKDNDHPEGQRDNDSEAQTTEEALSV
jgi:hypothetical protein